MALYQLQKKLTGDPFQFVVKKGSPDVVFRDGNLNSPHYLEYKSWVDAGNTPDPAD